MSLAFAPYGKEVEVTKINADDKTRKHLNDLELLSAAGSRPYSTARVTSSSRSRMEGLRSTALWP